MDEIVREVASWPGVAAEGSVLRYAGRELGTVGEQAVTLRYPGPVREMLLETGRVEPAPDGRVAYRLGEPAEAVELFRLAYERARVAERVRDARRT